MGVWRYQSILLKPYKFKHERNVCKQKFLATNYSFWRHSLGKMNTARIVPQCWKTKIIKIGTGVDESVKIQVYESEFDI